MPMNRAFALLLDLAHRWHGLVDDLLHVAKLDIVRLEKIEVVRLNRRKTRRCCAVIRCAEKSKSANP